MNAGIVEGTCIGHICFTNSCAITTHTDARVLVNVLSACASMLTRAAGTFVDVLDSNIEQYVH